MNRGETAGGAAQRDCGAARAAPLVLIHGAANDANVWRDVLPRLAAAGIRTIVPELPGHGAAAGSALPSIEAAADWLLRFIDDRNLASAFLAGHSMGSLIALEAAARGGRRIAGIALLGCSVPMPVSAPLLAAARETPDAACRMIADWSHTLRFQLAGGGGHGVWGAGKTLAVLRRNAGCLASDLAACAAYANGINAAAALDGRSLLVVGMRDRMTPARATAPLQAALKNCERCEIIDCGHAMMAERSDEVAAALTRFVRAG